MKTLREWRASARCNSAATYSSLLSAPASISSSASEAVSSGRDSAGCVCPSAEPEPSRQTARARGMILFTGVSPFGVSCKALK
jgi:hypothetical protein